MWLRKAVNLGEKINQSVDLFCVCNNSMNRKREMMNPNILFLIPECGANNWEENLARNLSLLVPKQPLVSSAHEEETATAGCCKEPQGWYSYRAISRRKRPAIQHQITSGLIHASLLQQLLQHLAGLFSASRVISTERFTTEKNSPSKEFGYQILV